MKNKVFLHTPRIYPWITYKGKFMIPQWGILAGSHEDGNYPEQLQAGRPQKMEGTRKSKR